MAIKATDGLTITVWQSCPDSKIAEEVQTATTDLIGQGKDKLAAMRDTMPKNLGELADTLVKSVKVSRRDRLVETVAALPATARDNLKAMPGELMALAFAAGEQFRGPTAKTSSVASHPSTAKDELPTGIEVGASLLWRDEVNLGANLQATNSTVLLLAVDITGPQVAQTAGIGFQKIDSAVADSGAKLTISPNKGFLNQSGSSDSFVSYMRSPLFSNGPPDGVRAAFVVDSPPSSNSKIARVDGSLKLLVATDSKTMKFDKVSTRLGKGLSNGDLRAAGIEMKLTGDAKSLSIQLTKGHPFSLKDVKLIRAVPRIELTPWVYLPALQIGTLVFGDEKVTAKDSLEVTIYTGLKEMAIPFAFENLPVPAPPPPKKGPDIRPPGQP